jgi:hypothetical protein
MKLYNGFWFPGTTGFTGRSHIRKNYHIEESKTLFSIPSWFPIMKYSGIGFQKHVPKGNMYNPLALEIILSYFKVEIGRYAGGGTNVQTSSYFAKYSHEINNKDKYNSRDGFSMASVMTLDDVYIGSIGHAWYLLQQGITKPERCGSRSGNICNIGYSNIDGKWYGWSHRAVFGFEIGSEVKKGDCAYTPVDLEDFMDDCTRFWSDDDHINVKTVICDEPDEYGDKVVYTSWKYADKIPNEKLRGAISGVNARIPDQYGKGAWIAKTNEDAKQMASDFASGVS